MRVSKDWVILLTAAVVVLAASGISAAPRIVWQLEGKKDFVGPIHRAAVADDAGREVYLATSSTLYRVEEGRVRIAAEQSRPGSRLALSPDGGVLAWLNPQSYGLFTPEVLSASGEKLGNLRIKRESRGMSAIFLGFQGRLLVTATPLADPVDALDGSFSHDFWRVNGELIRSVTLGSRQAGFIAPDGRAIVLLGHDRARAFSETGEPLWEAAGRYRSAALADGGMVSLLNPAEGEDIDKVLLVDKRQRPAGAEPAIHRLQAPTPVHFLRLVPDGARALIAGSNGRYFLLDVGERKMREGQGLGFEGRFTISDAAFLDGEVIVLGVLHRREEPPREPWSEGSLVVLDREGGKALEHRLPISDPRTASLSVNARFGRGVFIGYSADAAVLVESREE